MSNFDPMPDLVSTQQEDNFQQANSVMSDILTGTTDNAPANKEKESVDDQLAVETKTTSCTHYINWAIDSRSLHIAKLATKGDKRGVIEANVEKDGHRFKLELCASGWRNSQDGYCAFYLTVADQDDLFVARYRVQVGDITRISSIRHDFHLGVGFPNFCQQETLDSIMADNTVRFLVTVEVFTCASKIKPPMRPPSISPAQTPEFTIARLINDMYRYRLHTDVTLLCQEMRIPVHKCILAHASPVFRAMFQHNLLENTLNEVRMHDWDTATVYSMVEFLYTAKIPQRSPEAKRIITSTNGSIDCDEDQFSLGALAPSSLSPSPEILASLRSSSLTPTAEQVTGLDDDGDDSKMCNMGIFGSIRSNVNMDVNVHIADSSCLPPPTVVAIAHGDNDSAMDCSGNDVKSCLTRHSTFKLFQLAEYYKIESLVIACCHQMHGALTVESACELLMRIERYAHVNEIRLIKESIWDFVTSNIREIKKSEGYNQLVRNHPDLLGQLIEKITK